MDAAGFNQIGQQLALSQNFQKAEKCFLQAIKLEPENACFHFDLAYLYLLLGNYKRGFEEFEWRLKIDDPLNHFYQSIYKPEKQWQGQDLHGKKILIYSEQGVGDGIHFFRYLKHLKELGAYTILSIHPPTIPLLKEHPWVDELCAQEDLPEYDYCCSIMSLPWHLQQFEITGEPYIVAPEKVVTFPPHSIAITWGGTPYHVNDANRSIPLSYFLSLKTVNLYSVQLEHRPDLGLPHMCSDLAPYIRNMSDTAVFLKNLDLLICCDTAVAHLAGAIGTPCWLLLPYIPDWRWGITGQATPWYDSLRLFRQQKPGDWQGVFNNVSAELNMLCKPESIAVVI